MRRYQYNGLVFARRSAVNARGTNPQAKPEGRSSHPPPPRSFRLPLVARSAAAKRDAKRRALSARGKSQTVGRMTGQIVKRGGAAAAALSEREKPSGACGRSRNSRGAVLGRSASSGRNRPPDVAPAERLRVAPGSPLCSDTYAPLRRSSGTTSGCIPSRAIRRAAPAIMAAAFCLPRVTADGGGRYAPPPTPRAGGKRGGSGITREGRRLQGDDNAARFRNVDALPTRWPLNNGAAFRAVLRTAPDDSKAEPSYHHGDAWQTSAPSLHCHLRRRFPRRCSILPRVPRRSHEATACPSVGTPLTIICSYGKPCFQHGTA